MVFLLRQCKGTKFSSPFQIIRTFQRNNAVFVLKIGQVILRHMKYRKYRIQFLQRALKMEIKIFIIYIINFIFSPPYRQIPQPSENCISVFCICNLGFFENCLYLCTYETGKDHTSLHLAHQQTTPPRTYDARKD